MLKALRKFAASLIQSNPITRALLRRIALDERALADLLSTAKIRYRLASDPHIRKLFDQLVEDTPGATLRDFEKEIFYEPGLGTLHGILADDRAIDALCADRQLLRKVLRNGRAHDAIVDEIAQYGPLVEATLLHERGQQTLRKHFAAAKEKPGAAEQAEKLLEGLHAAGALEAAIATGGPIAHALSEMIGARERNGAQGKRSVLTRLLDELAKANGTGVDEAQLAGALRREWIMRVLANNEDWCRRFLERPEVLERAAAWDAYAAAYLSEERVLDRVAGNGFLLDRLFRKEPVRSLIERRSARHRGDGFGASPPDNGSG